MSGVEHMEVGRNRIVVRQGLFKRKMTDHMYRYSFFGLTKQFQPMKLKLNIGWIC